MSRTYRAFVKTIGRNNNHRPKHWFRAMRNSLRRLHRWTDHAGGSHVLSDDSIMPSKVVRKLLDAGWSADQVISRIKNKFKWTELEARQLVEYFMKPR
ncbi:hypothetical protein COT97_01035 [Candidatus Falkowbacteria bacterium CG10_big_fil_rev_8_21_14_0_10_39_11]|uniref:Uncharacterized protein n=1 Tax=Candidatus Falkowbacteria bacterium CG10_big_fil_rev_8_21_14_0_10_39_11 TaxID=1974565 RepID=A0A2H0V607_9BACT|nr:MAG: hypothetical protein COT97_01035 [Candidatus Falkowbacteria bacterium CG10_big_fil_rev_8_21_14_0_10_39_11]